MNASTEFERDVIERLTRIEEQNRTQFRRLESVEKDLNGNGRPGLLARVQDLESRRASLASVSASVVAWLAVLVALVGLILSRFPANHT